MEKYAHLLGRHFYPVADPHFGATFDLTLLHEMHRAVVKATLQASGKRVYGEKQTPFHGTALEVVGHLYDYRPDVRFVNLIRDGRDVLASRAAQWFNLRLNSCSPSEREGYELLLKNRSILPEDFAFFLEDWKDSIEGGAWAQTRFKNVLNLHYEELCEQPVKEVRRLFAFLGISSSEPIVRQCLDAASFERLSGGRPRGVEDRSSFFRKAEPGDWTNWLTPLQQEQFLAVAGGTMEKAGYAVS